VAKQETNKLVVMGHINFEDFALIKRWWVGKKMNAKGGMFKDEKKRMIVISKLCLLLEVVCIFKVLEFITT